MCVADLTAPSPQINAGGAVSSAVIMVSIRTARGLSTPQLALLLLLGSLTTPCFAGSKPLLLGNGINAYTCDDTGDPPVVTCSAKASSCSSTGLATFSFDPVTLRLTLDPDEDRRRPAQELPWRLAG